MSADETLEPEERTYTITEAADAAGVARSTIRRALDRGDFPNAAQDDDDPRSPWRIPTGDLEAAGYAPQEPPQAAPQAAGPDATGSPLSAPQGAPQEPSRALISLADVAPIFDRLADAERRAGEAEGRAHAAERESAHLRERLEEIRARTAEEEDGRRGVAGMPWPVALLVAVAALVVVVLAIVAAVTLAP